MKNILVVDDSQTVLFDIRKKIQDTDREIGVFTSSNYDDALSILELKKINLAIIDLQMPEKNGADLIVHMKSSDELKDIPIIVLTSTGVDSLLKTSLVDMVNHYLPKPISQKKIEELLLEFS